MLGRPTKNQMWLLMSAVLVFVLSTPACGGTVSPTSEQTATPVPMRTSLPTSTPTPEVNMFCDVWCSLEGPAGDPASRNPQTGVEVIVRGSDVVQVAVESPSGETIAVSPYGDIPYGWEGRFSGMTEGLPQAGGTYTCTARRRASNQNGGPRSPRRAASTASNRPEFSLSQTDHHLLIRSQ
jgi:hypothetical protein